MSLSAATLDPILDAWPISRPRISTRVYSGLNNHSWRITCPEGEYYLRIHQNTRDMAHVRHEHALLGALQRAGLSFRVPAPLATRTGETLQMVRMMDDDGAEVERVTILCPLLPGHHPDRTNPADIGVAGGALGELDRALASLDLAVTPPPFTYGDLHAIHPAVPDPLALPDAIGRDDEQRRQLRALFGAVMAAVPGLYAALPQQLIHNDCSIGNVLIAAGQATGMLDFEFAARDLRAIDFVVGLYFIALNQALQQGAVIWERVEAFCHGYGAWVHLTAEEIAALPMLLRLRSLVGLIHWTGRARLGVATAAEAAGYRDDALRIDGWLSAEGDTCIARVAQWLDEGSRLQSTRS